MAISDDNSDKIKAYTFVVCFCVMLVGFGFFAVTGRPQPGVRIISTAFWIVFAVLNFVNFYTGRITFKNGPTFNRVSSPKSFYFAAILFAIPSMGIATFLLWMAYFGD